MHNTRLTYFAQSHSKNRIATSMQLPKNRKINKSANSIYQLQLVVTKWFPEPKVVAQSQPLARRFHRRPDRRQPLCKHL